MSRTDLPILTFNSPEDWANWLAKNHSKSNGVWLRLFKKDSGVESLTHAGALDEALCYGWIDGQAKKYDEKSWLLKFTPRRPKSIWSKRNIEHIKRLTEAGKMKPAGLKEVEAAKSDGRWERAYDSPSTMEVPDDFLRELSNRKMDLQRLPDDFEAHTQIHIEQSVACRRSGVIRIFRKAGLFCDSGSDYFQISVIKRI